MVPRVGSLQPLEGRRKGTATEGSRPGRRCGRTELRRSKLKTGWPVQNVAPSVPDWLHRAQRDGAPPLLVLRQEERDSFGRPDRQSPHPGRHYAPSTCRRALRRPVRNRQWRPCRDNGTFVMFDAVAAFEISRRV